MKRKESIKNYKRIFKKYGICLAYVFGSTARKEANPRDLDIAVLFPRSISRSERFRRRLIISEELIKIVGRLVDVIVLNDTASLILKYAVLQEGHVIYTCHEKERTQFELSTMDEYLDFEPFITAYSKQYVSQRV